MFLLCHNHRNARKAAAARFYFLLLIAGSVSGCDRESRKFHTDPSMSTTPATTPQIDLLVDRSPQLDIGGSEKIVYVDSQKYERNAFNLSQGQWMYSRMNCSTCHAAGGGGDIGPTLNDDRWIYGHEPMEIFKSIASGRPNGMPAYGARMSQEQIWQLTAYVRSLGGFVPKTIAPGRDDNMQTSIPPNSSDPPPVEYSMPSPGTYEAPH